MIRIHREGRTILFRLLLALVVLNLLIGLLPWPWLEKLLLISSLVLYLFVLQFFRNPRRQTPENVRHVISPADGKIVAIEEIDEPEYFQERMMQISIFMSPLNVHVNRYPIPGLIKYAKYHPGAYLVAWHPKSSTLNERTTVVIESPEGRQLMYKQIAGAVARRIIMYAEEGKVVKQGADSGFIRFGSRVDVVLPLDANILVKIGDKARGGEQVLAELK